MAWWGVHRAILALSSLYSSNPQIEFGRSITWRGVALRNTGVHSDVLYTACYLEASCDGRGPARLPWRSLLQSEARVGDTLFHKDTPVEALPGFKPARCMVFAGVYPLAQVTITCIP